MTSKKVKMEVEMISAGMSDRFYEIVDYVEFEEGVDEEDNEDAAD